MFLGDFHIHTRFSDGTLTVAQVVDLYGQQGFGAIGITDHLCEEKTWMGRAAKLIGHTLTQDRFGEYLAELELQAARAWDQYRMIVFAGYELSKNTVSNSRSAHILGLGVTDWVSADLDPIEISKKLHDQGALCIAAHPVSTRKWEKQTYYLWDRRRELESHFDAWEVASGPYLFDEVLSERLPMIASSDLHVPRQFRSWKTSFECEKHPQAILEALRKQEVRFEFVELPNQILTAQRQAIV